MSKVAQLKLNAREESRQDQEYESPLWKLTDFGFRYGVLLEYWDEFLAEFDECLKQAQSLLSDTSIKELSNEDMHLVRVIFVHMDAVIDKIKDLKLPLETIHKPFYEELTDKCNEYLPMLRRETGGCHV